MNRHTIPLMTAAFGAAILLAGCTAPAGFQALNRQATADDNVPEGFTFEGTDVQAESARLLASQDGVKYFAAQNKDSHEACLVIVPEAKDSLWIAGCGSFARGGEVITVTNATGLSAVLVTDGTDTDRRQSEGWTKVHDNVLTSRR